MPVTVGGGSPSSPPAAAVPPWVWAAPCGCGRQIQLFVVGQVPVIGCRHPRCAVPFGGRGGRSATVSRPTECPGGRYDDCSGRLRTLEAVGGRGGRERGDADHGRRWVTVPITRRCRPTVGLGCSLWLRPETQHGTSVELLPSVVETRGASSLSVVEEVALPPSRGPPSVRVAGMTSVPALSGASGRGWSPLAESGRCWSRSASGRRPHHPPSPVHRGSSCSLWCGPKTSTERRSSCRRRPRTPVTRTGQKNFSESWAVPVENPGFGG
jgi:hypothetical protein